MHPKEDVEDRLATIIIDTIFNKGNLIIPSFAVERLQTLMYILWKLYKKNKIPNIPIFVDSPMGNRVLAPGDFGGWSKFDLKDFREEFTK